MNLTGNESTSNITINTINNKNEVQGYYLNIINTKQPNKEEENKENRNINEKENEDNCVKNKKNELLPNCNKKTLKVKTSRE